MRSRLFRVAASLAILWGVITLAFFINHALPSDPARMVAGPHARPADVARIRDQLGLSRPPLEQYARFMRQLVHLASADPKAIDHATCESVGPLHVDLGRSYQQHRPVVRIIAERAPRSLLLACAAAFIQFTLGSLFGTLAALRKNSVFDTATVGMTLLGMSAPTFLIGIVLQIIFAKELGLLPLDGYGVTAWEHARSLILPALTLGIFGAAYTTRIVRDSMIAILSNDYIRSARAKGGSLLRVVVVHAFRNALIPLVTIVGVDLGALVGGAVVTESLFRWPGIGALTVRAALDRDGPVLMGTVVVSAGAMIAMSIVVDVLCAWIDPKGRVPSI